MSEKITFTQYIMSCLQKENMEQYWREHQIGRASCREKPLTKIQIQKIRQLVENKPLQELLLNLSVDLMLRASDLLALRVSDVITKNGAIKTEVKVKQKKTGKSTLPIPLSKTSLRAISKHLSNKPLDDYGDQRC